MSAHLSTSRRRFIAQPRRERFAANSSSVAVKVRPVRVRGRSRGTSAASARPPRAMVEAQEGLGVETYRRALLAFLQGRKEAGNVIRGGLCIRLSRKVVVEGQEGAQIVDLRGQRRVLGLTRGQERRGSLTVWRVGELDAVVSELVIVVAPGRDASPLDRRPRLSAHPVRGQAYRPRGLPTVQSVFPRARGLAWYTTCLGCR
jgi:hypothetical protein